MVGIEVAPHCRFTGNLHYALQPREHHTFSHPRMQSHVASRLLRIGSFQREQKGPVLPTCEND